MQGPLQSLQKALIARGKERCGLTLRSSGPPPASRLARDPASVIIRLAGQAPSRRCPLSSNVRPRTTTHAVTLPNTTHIRNVPLKNFALSRTTNCLALTSVAFLLASCASGTTAPIPVVDQSKVGRYFQMSNPDTGEVVTQINLASINACLGSLSGALQGTKNYLRSQLGASASRAEVDQLASKYWACSSQDQAGALPYRTTTRIRKSGVLVDIYASSQEACESSSGPATAESEIVSPCQKY